MPSDRRFPLIELLWIGNGDPPCVCGFHGGGLHVINEIEEEFRNNEEYCEKMFRKGPGVYLYEASFCEPQLDGCGRTEIEGCWDLEEKAFRSL